MPGPEGRLGKGHVAKGDLGNRERREEEVGEREMGDGDKGRQVGERQGTRTGNGLFLYICV